jgi:hypothetical protein
MKTFQKGFFLQGMQKVVQNLLRAIVSSTYRPACARAQLSSIIIDLYAKLIYITFL